MMVAGGGWEVIPVAAGGRGWGWLRQGVKAPYALGILSILLRNTAFLS